MTDWAAETTKYIEKTVANIRDRTVKPAYAATHYLVYGLIAIFLTLGLLTVATILAFRGLTIAANLLPGPQDNAWIAWSGLGGMFCVIGAFLWSKRGSLS